MAEDKLALFSMVAIVAIVALVMLVQGKDTVFSTATEPVFEQITYGDDGLLAEENLAGDAKGTIRMPFPKKCISTGIDGRGDTSVRYTLCLEATNRRSSGRSTLTLSWNKWGTVNTMFNGSQTNTELAYHIFSENGPSSYTIQSPKTSAATILNLNDRQCVRVYASQRKEGILPNSYMPFTEICRPVQQAE